MKMTRSIYSFTQGYHVQQKIKISINTDISKIRFYECIRNIGKIFDGYFYKNIDFIIIYLF